MTSQSLRLESNRTNQWPVLISPILVILIGHGAARVFVELLGQWAWLGTALVYWATLLTMIAAFGGMASLRRWLGKPQAGWPWLLFAVVMGSIGFPLLLIPNIALMNSVVLVILWFLFAVVNATCEELYWRGFLLDSTSYLPRWFGIAYSTALFTAIHPAMLGVFSDLNRFHWSAPLGFLPFGIIAIALSLSFAAMYLNTKTLRVPIFSHFLSDLGSMSVFVFMNLIAAPPM